MRGKGVELCLEPIKLVRDGNETAKCPRCGEALTYVGSQPVQIVDGKLNVKDSEAHYKCEHCNCVYRPILRTEYYQWYAE